jgi:hypothetical protein
MPTQQTDSISGFSLAAFRFVWYRLWSVVGTHSHAKHTGKMRPLVLCFMARVELFFYLILSCPPYCCSGTFLISLLSKDRVSEDVLFILCADFRILWRFFFIPFLTFSWIDCLFCLISLVMCCRCLVFLIFWKGVLCPSIDSGNNMQKVTCFWNCMAPMAISQG